LSQIPKIIHYCWFGDTEMSATVENCILTWKKHLSDYKLIFWNETNFKSSSNFYEYAIDNRQWAFAADYARLAILYKYGGIYLDTDMYVISSFEELLQDEFFMGIENTGRVSCGIIGTRPNHETLKAILDQYDSLKLDEACFKIAITKRFTRFFFKKYSLEILEDRDYNLEDAKLYKSDYFYPYPYNKNQKLNKNFLNFIQPKTLAIHLWEGSWLGYSEFEYLRRRQYKKAIKKIISEPEGEFSFYYFRKILSCLKYSLFNG